MAAAPPPLKLSMRVGIESSSPGGTTTDSSRDSLGVIWNLSNTRCSSNHLSVRSPVIINVGGIAALRRRGVGRVWIGATIKVRSCIWGRISTGITRKPRTILHQRQLTMCSLLCIQHLCTQLFYLSCQCHQILLHFLHFLYLLHV